MFGSVPGVGVMLATGGVDVVIVRSRGSITTVPSAPCGAAVSAVPVRRNPLSPDTSTVPPSPDTRPPLAVSVPSIVVDCVLSTVTRPPSPLAVPSAEIRAPAAIIVRAEVPAGADPVPRARASVVPTATVPPPAWPFAVTRAAGAMLVVSLPATTTLPPVVPGARPSAATRPSITTEPPVPVISICPARAPTVLARTLPPACTSVFTTPSAARAVNCTVPPSAAMVPVLVTSAVTVLPSAPTGACVTCLVMSMDTSPSPYMSSVCVVAPARTTWPKRAVMVPELATDGATSAANPASLTVIVPALVIRAFGLPGWSNTIRPAMKFWLLIPGALTITLCAFTCAPAWNTTPDGLVSTSWPLALIRPAMADGSGPVTRFSVTLLAPGWLKTTL